LRAGELGRTAAAEIGRTRVGAETLPTEAASGSSGEAHQEAFMLAKFIVRALFGALGLWLSSVLVAGVDFSDNTSLILAAVLLGIVNAFVRPVVFVLTLPLTIVTLGLFLLIVNAAMIGLVAWLLSGFQVSGLIPGILAAIITGVTSWIGGMILRDDRR
jgi:putative membrane protein